MNIFPSINNEICITLTNIGLKARVPDLMMSKVGLKASSESFAEP